MINYFTKIIIIIQVTTVTLYSKCENTIHIISFNLRQ